MTKDQMLKRIMALEIALEESVKLQSHYAKQLNIYDGGKRRPFENAEAWIDRLIETKTLSTSDVELQTTKTKIQKHICSQQKEQIK